MKNWITGTHTVHTDITIKISFNPDSNRDQKVQMLKYLNLLFV